MDPAPLKPYKSGRPFTASPKDELELLERARAVLTPRGAWKKGGWSGQKSIGGELYGQRCLVQTLKDCDGKLVNPAITKFIIPAITALYPDRVSFSMGESAAVKFNDHTKTTKYDVLRVLDEALARAEEEYAGA